VRNSGFNLTPQFSLLATLGIVPIVWTSLQWATYSVEQSTEIAEADRFSKQLWMLLFSAFSVTLLLALVAHVEHKAISERFVLAASASYWLQKGSPETVAFVKTTVQPFPNILAMAASGSILLSTIIALGFVANAFQVTCNCFIGVTRILVAMSVDGLLDRRLHLEKVDPRRHAPVRAHWIYFFASLPIIACYNLIPTWANYTLGVTFACGYVFTSSALAATRIPTRMRTSWETSEVYRVRPTVIRSIGYLGFASGGAMVLSYLILPQLGITGSIPYLIVFGVVLVSWALYLFARTKSSLAAKVLEQAPEEVPEFFEDREE
jgi:amino acid transporter